MGNERRVRLHRWAGEYGGPVVTATSLLPELVMIVAEFCVPLEHLWEPLPDHLRVDRTCGCMRAPFKTALFCLCRSWFFQHFCSVYTLEESGSCEFELKLNRMEGKRWWIGVLWSSSHDGLEAIPPPFRDESPSDSWSYIPDVYSCTLDHDRRLAKIHATRSGQLLEHGKVQQLPHFHDLCTGIVTINLKIRVSIHAAEFTLENFEPVVVLLPWRMLSGFYARPVVQFENAQSTAAHNSFVTINTPLH